MKTASSRTFELRLRGECGLSCEPCDCRDAGLDPEEIRRRLSPGGSRLVLRGGAEGSPDLTEVLRIATEKVSQIVLRTNALRYREPAAAQALAATGVTGALVPLFSHTAFVHDRIAGQEGALVGALVGMRSLASAGLSLEVEIPLLPPRLQDLRALVDLARRAVPGLSAVRLFVPEAPVANAIAPPSWPEVSGAIAAVIDDCERESIRLAISPDDGIPFCALADQPESLHAFHFHPNRPARDRGWTKPDACDDCAASAQCPGPTPAYLRRWGGAGLSPFEKKPRELFDQRTGRLRVWTDDERRAARRSNLLVLRPTVHCNQDCSFCSANETTQNVWSDPDEMKRAIARAADRGVRRVSFSGGEPTLEKQLPTYVEIAHRCGIEEIEVVTNAVLLARRERVTALREAGLTHAFVSLHAHDEMLSRAMTNKIGDFERTLAGIHNLVDAGVTTVINHVLTSRNHRFVTRFVEMVHAELGGRVPTTFAFVTPQFKALEHMELVPRISDVMPSLERAMYRALELGQPFWVGSRQGIPPCLLGPFAGWSDAVHLASEAAAEDASQKTRAEGCDRCLYGGVCQGLWKPYAARYGVDELSPVEGPPLTEPEREVIATALRANPAHTPASFDDVPDRLRRRALEGRMPTIDEPAEAPTVERTDLERSRPLRVVVAGSGLRARAFAAAIAAVEGIDVAAVASPHAPELDLSTAFGGAPAYDDVAAALEGTDPDALVVASATHSHDALVRAAIDAGVPVLCEKPLTNRVEGAVALVEHARERGVMLAVVHNLLFAPGVAELAAERLRDVTITRRLSPGSPDRPRSWEPEALYQSLYHLVALLVGLVGREEPVLSAATHSGDTRPERLSIELAYPSATARIRFEADARDELVIDGAREDGRFRWSRGGRDVVLDRGEGPAAVERRGSELESMLRSFRDAVADGKELRPDGEDALATMRITRALMRSLREAGAPFDRDGAPRHGASRELSSADLWR